MSIEIRTGIPIPERGYNNGKLSEVTKAFQQMKIGDCIDVPKRKHNLYSNAKIAGIKFTTRTVTNPETGEKVLRIWRIA